MEKIVKNILELPNTFVRVKTLDQIYRMYPRLDYCNIIYHTPATLNEFNSQLV